MRRAALVASIVLPLLAGAAISAEPPGRLYLGQILYSPVTVEIDGKLQGPVCASCRAFLPLTPGRHEITVVTSRGHRLSQSFDFPASEAVELRGRRFWCVIVGSPVETDEGDAQGVMVHVDAQDCQTLMATVPADERVD
jgi:hypothetical protein